MSSFYHEFVPGFNTWYVVAPLLLVAAAIVGGVTLRRVNTSFQTGLALGLSIGASVYITDQVCEQSFNGILQLFDNCLAAGESGVWSVLFASVAIVFFAFLFGVMFFLSFWLGAKIKVAYVKLMKKARWEQRCR
ncbi:MAG: hypothetical protein Q4B34_00525 [Candidatus Saccharibacteria bacterium]|nr:hypothetical protein [Candidatus Saccharibacteria bacterium]